MITLWKQMNAKIFQANDSYALEVQALKSDLKMFEESNGNLSEM